MAWIFCVRDAFNLPSSCLNLTMRSVRSFQNDIREGTHGWTAWLWYIDAELILPYTWVKKDSFIPHWNVFLILLLSDISNILLLFILITNVKVVSVFIWGLVINIIFPKRDPDQSRLGKMTKCYNHWQPIKIVTRGRIIGASYFFLNG